MKKLKRSTKEYGGGSGHKIFKSDLFYVVLWNLRDGARTTITIEDDFLGKEIHFDEKQKFNSDEECLIQLTPTEILKIIKYQKRISFKKGIQNKLDEIKECLEM